MGRVKELLPEYDCEYGEIKSSRHSVADWWAEQGWHYEPEDRSVGIFGIGVVHNDCPLGDDVDWAEYEVTDVPSEPYLSRYTATCKCGATISFLN